MTSEEYQLFNILKSAVMSAEYGRFAPAIRSAAHDYFAGVSNRSETAREFRALLDFVCPAIRRPRLSTCDRCQCRYECLTQSKLWSAGKLNEINLVLEGEVGVGVLQSE